MFIQYNLQNNLSIHIDPGFERKGSLMKMEQIKYSMGAAQFNTSLDYFTLPILVRFSYGKKTRFFANIDFVKKIQ